MKKWIIIVVIAVLVLGGGYLAISSSWDNGTTGGFTTQRIVIQGNSQEVFASKSKLPQTFTLAVPSDQSQSSQSQSAQNQSLATPSRPRVFYNPGNCTCFSLDPERHLPTGVFDCSTGVQAPTDKTFSVFCQESNSLFYLTR